jgi:hypothetical protein
MAMSYRCSIISTVLRRVQKEAAYLAVFGRNERRMQIRGREEYQTRAGKGIKLSVTWCASTAVQEKSKGDLQAVPQPHDTVRRLDGFHWLFQPAQ